MELKILEDKFKVIKLSANDEIPKGVLEQDMVSITKTDEEVSIVIKSDFDIARGEVEDNWRAIKVVGQLDFALIGILSKISTVLTNANISIFAISTYNTDYILMKNDKLEQAINALKENGYSFI